MKKVLQFISCYRRCATLLVKVKGRKGSSERRGEGDKMVGAGGVDVVETNLNGQQAFPTTVALNKQITVWGGGVGGGGGVVGTIRSMCSHSSYHRARHSEAVILGRICGGA